MKSIVYLFVGFIIFSGMSACKKCDLETQTSKCIEIKICEFKKYEECENGVQVLEYLFQDKTVYVFDPGNCGADMSADIFDSECKRLGYLGGIGGNMKINDVHFGENSTFVRTVWAK